MYHKLKKYVPKAVLSLLANTEADLLTRKRYSDCNCRSNSVCVSYSGNKKNQSLGGQITNEEATISVFY